MDGGLRREQSVQSHGQGPSVRLAPIRTKFKALLIGKDIHGEWALDRGARMGRGGGRLTRGRCRGAATCKSVNAVPTLEQKVFLVVDKLLAHALIVGEGNDGVHDFASIGARLVRRYPLLEHFAA